MKMAKSPCSLPIFVYDIYDSVITIFPFLFFFFSGVGVEIADSGALTALLNHVNKPVEIKVIFRLPPMSDCQKVKHSHLGSATLFSKFHLPLIWSDQAI